MNSHFFPSSPISWKIPTFGTGIWLSFPLTSRAFHGLVPLDNLGHWHSQEAKAIAKVNINYRALYEKHIKSTEGYHDTNLKVKPKNTEEIKGKQAQIIVLFNKNDIKRPLPECLFSQMQCLAGAPESVAEAFRWSLDGSCQAPVSVLQTEHLWNIYLYSCWAAFRLKPSQSPK